MKSIHFPAALVLALLLFAPGRLWAQDSDGDGVSDDLELELGSNPADPAITPRLITLQHIESSADWSRLVWTGSEYGYFWAISNLTAPNSSLYMQRIDRFGKFLGNEIMITDNTRRNFGISWTGSEYWIQTKTNSSVLIRLNRKGIRVSEDKPDVPEGSMVWTGSEMAIFNYTNSQYSLFRYDANANLVGSRLLAENLYITTSPDEVWTGSEFGAVYCTDSTQLVRISSDGQIIEQKTITDQYLLGVSLVWTGSEYVTAWSNSFFSDGSQCSSYYECPVHASFLQRLDPTGNPAAPVLRIDTPGVVAIKPYSFAGDAFLAWTGSYLGLFTTDLSADSDGICDSTECSGCQLLNWMTPDAKKIIQPNIAFAYNNNNFIFPAQSNSPDIAFTYYDGSVYNMLILAPDSDGDGMSDTLESEGCLSPFNYDTDGDGKIDSLEDPDHDGLIGVRDLKPCTAAKDKDKDDDNPDCALGPAGTGAGVELGFLLPLLLILGARKLAFVLPRRDRD